MGHTRHHTIIVTSDKRKALDQARALARELFDAVMISEIVVSPVNAWSSFFIAPDGGKEGWAPSDKGDEARKVFTEQLATINGLDWVEVMYGDDDGFCELITGSDEIMRY